MRILLKRYTRMEFIIMIVVLIWGVIITIFVLTTEFSHITERRKLKRENRELRLRVTNLEKCHGKEREETETA